MKKLIMMIAAAALVGCKTEEPTGIAVQYIDKAVTAAGGTASFTIHPGEVQDWSISFPYGRQEPWIELSRMNGSGRSSVTATLAPNTDLYDRNTTVIITTGRRNLPIIIRQSAAELNFRVTPASYADLPHNEGGQYLTRPLTVEANINWYAEVETAATAGNWIYFLPDGTLTHGSAAQSKFGDAELTLRIDNNYAVSANLPRSGKVIFYNISGEVLQEVQISQLSE